VPSNVVTVDTGEYENFPPDNISFSTVEDFKGLENRFIVLVDIDDIDGSAETMSSVYVAMSRARVALCTILSESALEKVRRRTLEHLDELGDDLEIR
jgi:hypothetical protein